MNFTDYITVFNNILKNFYFLKSDFIGIKFSANGFLYFIMNTFLATLFIVVYYLIGKKLRLLFLNKTTYKNLNVFIDVALGYIFVNSGLAVLGIFSLLYPVVLWAYIIIILVLAFYPYYDLVNAKDARKLFKIIKDRSNSNKWIFFGILLFVLIAFLRLIPPETGEDAIGYHTSDPHLFLKNNTMMIAPKSSTVAILTPHLGEMSYMLSEFIGFKDSARYIHFAFYFLVVFLLALKYPYSALFFVTAPVVIQVSSKANVDFQWILCWLLSIFLIVEFKLKGIRNIILIAVLLGGVLASKLWTIAFFPIFILFILIIHRKLDLGYKFRIILIFSLFTFLVEFVWLWRSYIMSGSPVYPAFSGALRIDNVIGFNNLMFHMQNVSVFSPLFYLTIIVFLFNWRLALKTLRKHNLSLFFVLLTSEYLFIKYHFGRYLLGLYSLAVLIISVDINNLIRKHKLYNIIFVVGFIVMFTYYFINTLLVLPYGLGWADKNKYLTRVLSRDNSSYYDFDRKFDHLISKKDKVATYETFGFYYANFDYIDVNYLFSEKKRSLELLKKHGVTKLFIKGGTIEWFCERLRVSDCSETKYKLIAHHPLDPKYLYDLYEN